MYNIYYVSLHTDTPTVYKFPAAFIKTKCVTFVDRFSISKINVLMMINQQIL